MINYFKNLIKEALKEALNETSVSLKVNQSTNNDFKPEDYILKSALKDDYILKSELEENYLKKELFNKLLDTFSKSLKEEYILKSTVNNEYILKSDVEKNYIKKENKLKNINEVTRDQTNLLDNKCVEILLKQSDDIHQVVQNYDQLVDGIRYQISIENFDLFEFRETAHIRDYFGRTTDRKDLKFRTGFIYRNDLIQWWMIDNEIKEIKIKICRI